MPDTALITGSSGGIGEELAPLLAITCLCPGPTGTGFQDRARMRESRLFALLDVASAADVARAGYDGMMAGRAIVIPGLGNKAGVQALRFAPRAVVRRLIRTLQDRRS